MAPASEKDPDGWSVADKFTVVFKTAGLNATEVSAYCLRERISKVRKQLLIPHADIGNAMSVAMPESRMKQLGVLDPSAGHGSARTTCTGNCCSA